MIQVQELGQTQAAAQEANERMNQYRATSHTITERQLDLIARRVESYVLDITDPQVACVGMCRPVLSFLRAGAHRRGSGPAVPKLEELLDSLYILGIEVIAQDAWDEVLEKPYVRFWAREVTEG
jgi:translation initiation factor 2B subunit (eIF-2B alpha/beta/delta family)